MTRGRAVQIGTASDLFERPRHTFVGHFIGSPGMNFLPARADASGVNVAGQRVMAASTKLAGSDPLTLGIRPEYVRARRARRARGVAGHGDAGAGHRHLLARHSARR